MPVIGSTQVYGNINGYTTGTVIWNLTFVEQSEGVIPVIDNTGLPPEKVGVLFKNPAAAYPDTGAYGWATISATVDGIPVGNTITAGIDSPILYSRYGEFVVNNGYGGDVGIVGYLLPSNPYVSSFSVSSGQYQTNPNSATSSSRLVNGDFITPNLSVGGGNYADYATAIGPMGIGNTNSYSSGVGSEPFLRHFWLPMRLGDQIWVVGTTFNGPNGNTEVYAVVGPSASSGEQYLCQGNSIGNRIYIEQIAWAGDR